jgi:uncharacterized protein YecA (UPF0149 family)
MKQKELDELQQLYRYLYHYCMGFNAQLLDVIEKYEEGNLSDEAIKKIVSVGSIRTIYKQYYIVNKQLYDICKDLKDGIKNEGIKTDTDKENEMKISVQITPEEYFKLGVSLQHLADEIKSRIKYRMCSANLTHLLIFEFMQSFNYNKFDFKDTRKEYKLSMNISTANAIIDYLLNEAYIGHHMVVEKSVLDKLNRAVGNYRAID